MENKKYVRKSFWIHQYEKEEIFLRDMRKKGWKFINLYKGLPTKYEFEKCEPEDYVYQLDYIKNEEDTNDYHLLFQDMGWEEIMPWSGYGGKWYYFCKKAENGKIEKIFTDQQSKLDLINKLIVTYGGLFLLVFALCLNSVNSMFLLVSRKTWLIWLDIPILGITMVGIVWIIYCTAGMLILRNKIKRGIKRSI